ncbi:MAG: DUF5678 domain-containing protein [Chloroflexi bacterium]|nr:DUF5678 domain-containing protein [Chloroflexota bacterium]
MTAPVTITLSDHISERVRKLAEQRHTDISIIVETILQESLSDKLDQQDWIDLSEPDEAAAQEMQAYIELHPMLKQKYFGKHVAIHGGKLVDYDESFDALYDRIAQAYPDEFVWMSQVAEEPIETFVVRSPRFVQDE